MRARLSTRGQLVIPKALRDRHGWHPGTELLLEDRGDSVVLRPVKPLPVQSLTDLIGCAGYQGSARSVAEMEAGIARGVRRRRRPR
jgi:AbrB family looped-hinge helix DNA binding protein